MSRINRVPRGLQDLLGSHNLGVNPADMSEQVRPTIDMFPHWAGERLTTFRTTSADIAGTGTAQTYQIPNGEAWIPLFISTTIQGFESVGDQASISIRIGQIGMQQGGLISATTRIATSGLVTAIQVGQQISARYDFKQRIQFNSGCGFQSAVEALVLVGAGPLQLSLEMIYYRLQV
jgi:hypothetical protein